MRHISISPLFAGCILHQKEDLVMILIAFHICSNKFDLVDLEFLFASHSPYSNILNKSHSKSNMIYCSTKELLAIRHIFSLVDMITNTKFSNCPYVFKIGVVWQ